jgi:hypothetical protein
MKFIEMKLIPMSTPKRIIILGSILFFSANYLGFTQELTLEEMLPELKGQAVVLNIVARVVEQNQQEVWNMSNSRVTIPGRPVGIKIVGTNILVAIQFTPYFRQEGHNVLVAQGQIWVDIPGKGIQYYTTMRTIPLEFGEQIYFFPLGQGQPQDDAYIEVQVELRPYVEGNETSR